MADEDDELRLDEDTPVADASDDQVEQEDVGEESGAVPMDIDESLKEIGLPHDGDDDSKELDPNIPK